MMKSLIPSTLTLLSPANLSKSKPLFSSCFCLISYNVSNSQTVFKKPKFLHVGSSMRSSGSLISLGCHWNCFTLRISITLHRQ
ncbi:hypothetical protein Dimus_017057 [Dionaea muscipula]